MRDRPPIHPGEVLLEDFIVPMKLSPSVLAEGMGVSVTQIQNIIDGKQDIDADMALRLSRYFGTSADVWIGLQSAKKNGVNSSLPSNNSAQL